MKHLIVFLSILSSPIIFAQTSNEKPDYVGYQSCSSCHEKEVKEWQSSHHKQAMQHASEETVLGDFNQTHFENYGLTTTFFKKDGKFWVNTDGPDGKLHDYKIKYTFGVYPLQQYLVEFPGGKLQALDIAWDSRPSKQGGQRWYHLHPDEKIESDDILHWTGPNLNWNYMCAFCHSTNLEKNYDSVNDSYNTQWSEINVSCEACHGPASQHLKWAELAKKDDNASYTIKNMGLTNPLDERKNSHWIIDKKAHKPSRSQIKSTQIEIETCARCHSRRSQLGKDQIHQPLMENFRPARLSSNLYFSDGQPKDEVYVYGSFIQSKMHHKGVTCSDCHNPHTNRLKAPGDQVCNQCHVSENYRSESHHFHKTDKKDAVSCLDCHMSATTFMGVDERNDHSFRIPRPDLSNNTDIPNVCNKCHTVNTPQWAEQRLKDWYNKRPIGQQNFAAVLHSQQQQLPIAKRKLHYLINDTNQPDIARATALEALINYPDKQSKDIITHQLIDSNPMIRLAALESLSSFDQRTQITLAFPLIYDDIKSIRMEAARLLISVPGGQLSENDKKQLAQVKTEYINSQLFNAERPESQVNLAQYYARSGDYKLSEKAYKQALQLQKQFVPAYLGLSQLFSLIKKENNAILILKDGLKFIPENADLHHALGLAYIRQKQMEPALKELESAANFDADNLRYQYVYAIALNSSGYSEKALKTLNNVYEKQPENTDIIIALITFNRNIGNYKDALVYAKKLDEISPNDPSIQRLIAELLNKI
ncbi:MAG: tetratricopeptide repeat protein [Gammaproteobacteria bacterium]|nr:tetratricopeptide repeat protein [Gammaproteobacteria bacterium]